MQIYIIYRIIDFSDTTSVNLVLLLSPQFSGLLQIAFLAKLPNNSIQLFEIVLKWVSAANNTHCLMKCADLYMSAPQVTCSSYLRGGTCIGMKRPRGSYANKNTSLGGFEPKRRISPSLKKNKRRWEGSSPWPSETSRLEMPLSKILPKTRLSSANQILLVH